MVRTLEGARDQRKHADEKQTAEKEASRRTRSFSLLVPFAGKRSVTFYPEDCESEINIDLNTGDLLMFSTYAKHHGNKYVLDGSADILHW